MAGQVVSAQSHSRLQHDASHYDFTPLGVRNSEDRHFMNRGMFVDDRFDLAGINIFATCDDHVFQPVEDVEIAIRIHHVLSAKDICNALLEYTVKKDDHLRQIG